MSSTDVLLVIALVSCIASAAVLGSLACHRIAGLNRWLAAHCALLFTFGVLIFRHGDYPPVAVLTACVCILAAAVLILQGCRQFAGRPTVSRYECLGFAAVVGAVFYWSTISVNENARAAVMSGMLAYTRMAVGWTIWNSRGLRQRRYGHWLVLAAAVFGAVIYLSRVVHCIFFASAHARVLEPTVWNLAFVSAGVLSLLLLSIGLVMLVNDTLVEQAQHLATIDELTGTLVRRAFMVRGEELVKAAKTAHAPLSVAIIDLDDFKLINDRYGHPVGDRVLKNFAMEVTCRLRRMDVLGRLGGEEFAILFPQTGKLQAAVLVEAILSSVGDVSAARDGEPRCSFSAGIDECGLDDTLNDVIARADAALYRAKRAGKGRVELASGEALAAS
jgi:diguanylate cyclase (GGDEF)-like protein